MGSRLAPEIDGTVSIQSSADAFQDAFRERVAAGLLTGQSRARSNYTLSRDGPESIEVRAADWLTAFNVGLNHVELRFPQPGLVRYRVRYWTWAQYALGLSAVIGLVGITFLSILDVRAYLARNERAMVPGLSVEAHIGIAWAMILFWGFVWPWLLIAMHRGPLRHLVTQLIAEVDLAAHPSGKTA